MKLGTNEPKKVAALGVLILVAGYLVYSNLFSSSDSSAPRRSAVTATSPDQANSAAGLPGDSVRPTEARARSGRGRTDEFHPVLHSKRPEERLDTSKIDPTLRLDLLAKLQGVDIAAGGRNPFKMGPPPAPKVDPPKGPEPKVIPKPVQEVKAAPPPGPPAPPLITLKYYGFSSPPQANAQKTAFFLDGEDILVAKEGDTLKRRYRVVKIGTTSVTMEDTDSKRQQTIPLTEEAS